MGEFSTLVIRLSGSLASELPVHSVAVHPYLLKSPATSDGMLDVAFVACCPIVSLLVQPVISSSIITTKIPADFFNWLSPHCMIYAECNISCFTSHIVCLPNQAVIFNKHNGNLRLLIVHRYFRSLIQQTLLPLLDCFLSNVLQLNLVPCHWPDVDCFQRTKGRP